MKKTNQRWHQDLGLQNIFSAEEEKKPTEDGNAGEELLVHLALADGRAHEDATIRIAVDAPEFDVGFGPDGGGARRSVDQSQLPETAALADGRGQFSVDEYLDFALVDHVEVVAFVPWWKMKRIRGELAINRKYECTWWEKIKIWHI